MIKLIILTGFLSINAFAQAPASTDLNQLTEKLLTSYGETQNVRINQNNVNALLPPYYDSPLTSLELKSTLLDANVNHAYQYSNKILNILSEEVTVNSVEPETGIAHSVTRLHTVKEFKDLAKNLLKSTN